MRPAKDGAARPPAPGFVVAQADDRRRAGRIAILPLVLITTHMRSGGTMDIGDRDRELVAR